MGRLLSLKEVRERLGLSRASVMRLIRTGELPAAKIAGRWRVDEDDLQRYIDQAKARTYEEIEPIEGQLSLFGN